MTRATSTPLRRIPGHPTPCEYCGAQIVFARTVAGPNGPGGKAMPLDALEDLAGNVAVRVFHRGEILARALQHDEQVDRPLEYSGMPHFATCTRRGPAATRQEPHR